MSGTGQATLVSIGLAIELYEEVGTGLPPSVAGQIETDVKDSPDYRTDGYI